MRRFVDPGAIFAGWVGVGMAATIVVSFVLVIAIEPIAWFLSLPAGMVIGYYANARSERLGGWGRMLANAAYAAVLTGVTTALLLLVFKAIFFFGDDGFRPPALGGQLSCAAGPQCVYARYQAEQGDALRAAGIDDLGSFEIAYWRQQGTTSAVLVAVPAGGGLFGGLLYGATRPRRRDSELVEA